MQVDNMPRGPSAWDIADILHPEMFSATAGGPSTISPASSFSRESSPISHHLPTPPQQQPYPSFPSSSPPPPSADPASDSFFSFLGSGDDPKSPDPFAFMQGTPADPSTSSPMSSFDFGFDFSSLPMMMTSPLPPAGSDQMRASPIDFNSMNMDMLMNMGGMGTMEMGIDPQLVDSPAPLLPMAENDPEEEEEEEASAPSKTRSKKRDPEPTRSSKRARAAAAKITPPPSTASSPQQQQQPESQDKLTLTIAPVKVGGRGTGRRGTVQSGGISKKSAVAPVNGALNMGNVAVYGGSVLKDKENESESVVPAAGKARGRARKAAVEALPSPPSSHHDEEAEEESAPPAVPSTSWGFTRPPAPPPPATASGGSILTGNALVAHGRKVTPFDLGIEGLNLSASFAIPPGTFNMTTPSAVGSSSGLGVNALIGAANGGAAYPKPAASHSTNTLRAVSEEGDGDGDEIPADWRPSAEMLAKMTSKEKRQLRNKISARNFRVRRKEYISTLELDIAERDRLLDAVRTELGTSRSENVALRQEIEALKRTLLDGRTPAGSGGWTMNVDNDVTLVGGLNLPPPAPLPERSAAEMLQQQQQQQALASSSNLLKPNTQKDRSGGNGKFWGGVGSLGGVLPVHTAFVPSVASGFASMGVAGMGLGNGLQENMNPLMRGREERQEVEVELQQEKVEEKKETFEGFADVNMFTMKSLDAYRMHLWGKMAAQYHWHQQQQAHLHHAQSQQHHQQPQLPQHQHLSGLAANLRPSYFTSVSAGVLSGKAASSSSSSLAIADSRTPLGNATNSSVANNGVMYTPLLATLLSGKQMSLFGKEGSTAQRGSGKLLDEKERERERRVVQQQQERQEEQARAAVLAAVASQTILRKLGQAFWEAFSGVPSSSSSVQHQHQQNWDADKVRRVLEGSAVVRIVDVVDPLPKAKETAVERASSGSGSGSTGVPESTVRPKVCGVIGRAVSGRREMSSPQQPSVGLGMMEKEKGVCDVLEEKMRSLALGAKEGVSSKRE